MRGASPYLAVIGVLLFTLLVVAGIISYLYKSSFRITPSPLIKNEASLKKYLGVTGTFPAPVKGIRTLSIAAQNAFKTTDDCIADKKGADPIFCFDSAVQNGKLAVNVYPNTEISQEHSEAINRLLNFNLLTILETRFGINSDKKNLYIDNGEDNFIFKW